MGAHCSPVSQLVGENQNHCCVSFLGRILWQGNPQNLQNPHGNIRWPRRRLANPIRRCVCEQLIRWELICDPLCISLPSCCADTLVHASPVASNTVQANPVCSSAAWTERILIILQAPSLASGGWMVITRPQQQKHIFSPLSHARTDEKQKHTKNR